MSDFTQAIVVVLRNEGGWVDNPKDPGGETAWGISTLIINQSKITNEELGFTAGVDPVVDNRQPGWLKKLSVDGAKAIYKKLFWDKFHYENILDQRVATKIFDCGINCGPKRAHIMAQKAANVLGQGLVVDGILGPHSMSSINVCDPDKFLQAMCEEMKKYYIAISTSNPTLKVFLKNWLYRASWVG